VCVRVCVRVCVCVCVRVCGRERERGRERECVGERERKREEGERVCVCVCVRERVCVCVCVYEWGHTGIDGALFDPARGIGVAGDWLVEGSVEGAFLSGKDSQTSGCYQIYYVCNLYVYI